ncbi:MAG: DUF167 domain-containing protein [Bryobacteraceae bacterium]|nr:DUF167 domain-containing protein [Bryobacteraceae bacterium]
MPDVVLSIKVVTRAARTEFGETLADGTRKVRLAAVPEHGQANDALCRFLAHEYGVAARQVSVVAGQTGTRKTVRIRVD